MPASTLAIASALTLPSALASPAAAAAAAHSASALTSLHNRAQAQCVSVRRLCSLPPASASWVQP